MKKIILLLTLTTSLGIYHRCSAQYFISGLKVFPHYIDYSSSNFSAENSLLAGITAVGSPYTTVVSLLNGCGPLAVKFVSFSTMKEKDKVVLNWQTAFEQNNKGFEVQRKLAGGNYLVIALVPSKSISGSSSLLLDYSYDDIENLTRTGQVFYRIKEIDRDGNSSFSEERLVNINEEKTCIVIYPNPARGTTRVILPAGSGVVDITLNNSEGNIIKRWNRVVDQLQLDNLHPDIYMLKILFKETGVMRTYKIIIL